jgi:hypothetical protein
MTATNDLEDSGDISKDFFPRDSMGTLELSDYSCIQCDRSTKWLHWN